jgi:hypothetical protein
MQEEISLNTETSTLRKKFRLHAMFCDEQTKAMHGPCSERLVGDAEVTAASNFKGYFSIEGDSTATRTGRNS